MKQALIRVLIALALALLTMAFTKFSLGGFIVLLAVWTIPLQAALIAQNIVHNRRLSIENPLRCVVVRHGRLYQADKCPRCGQTPIPGYQIMCMTLDCPLMSQLPDSQKPAPFAKIR